MSGTNGNGKLAHKLPLRVPKHGRGKLLTGGKIGHNGKNAGRPPNWLKDWCDDILANPKHKTQVEKILADNSHPAFAVMWRAVADRAAGKPEQSVKHSGNVSVEHLLLERAQRVNGDRSGS